MIAVHLSRHDVGSLKLRHCRVIEFYTNSAADPLFILVRDVDDFEAVYESSVLAFVRKDLDFTGRERKPQRIVQEGCLPIDLPSPERETFGEESDEGHSGEDSEEYVSEDSDSSGDSEDQRDGALIEAVDELDVTKYVGSWTQVYPLRFAFSTARRGIPLSYMFSQLMQENPLRSSRLPMS